LGFEGAFLELLIEDAGKLLIERGLDDGLCCESPTRDGWDSLKLVDGPGVDACGRRSGAAAFRGCPGRAVGISGRSGNRVRK